ncbi:pyridoxamine 5'-phosphate oxidase family protein [Streptomyces marincola]|uniref:pyridoxamine 5'-phosphate oxidase family protein n=1 Tax=Streptomyces marincola TaxID=2878388 RepID=UPI000A340E7A
MGNEGGGQPPALPGRRRGSEGERALQRRLGTERRAERFYDEQVLDHLNERMREFVARQEMFFLATSDARGECDNTFRAGPPGFLHVLDPGALAFPEYRGNGVHASLGNITENPHAGLLLMDFDRARIGLHINGRARVVTDAELRAEHPELPTDTIPGRRAELWVRIEVEEAYIHCAKHIPQLVKATRRTAREWGTDDYKRKGGDFFGAARDAQARREGAPEGASSDRRPAGPPRRPEPEVPAAPPAHAPVASLPAAPAPEPAGHVPGAPPSAALPAPPPVAPPAPPLPAAPEPVPATSWPQSAGPPVPAAPVAPALGPAGPAGPDGGSSATTRERSEGPDAPLPPRLPRRIPARSLERSSPEPFSAFHRPAQSSRPAPAPAPPPPPAPVYAPPPTPPPAPVVPPAAQAPPPAVREPSTVREPSAVPQPPPDVQAWQEEARRALERARSRGSGSGGGWFG